MKITFSCLETDRLKTSKLFTRCYKINLVTYKEAIDLYRKKYNGHVRSSYIADLLHAHGKTKRKSTSRKGDIKYPCPKEVRPNLEKILKELKMI